jgi:hypothetical protein
MCCNKMSLLKFLNGKKQEVLKRIKKYSKNPELLIAEKQALKMIKEL